MPPSQVVASAPAEPGFQGSVDGGSAKFKAVLAGAAEALHRNLASCGHWVKSNHRRTGAEVQPMGDGKGLGAKLCLAARWLPWCVSTPRCALSFGFFVDDRGPQISRENHLSIV
jgi:hypothetical protein